MTGTDIIKDGIERIMLGLREGKFTKEDLTMLSNWFAEAHKVTRKKLLIELSESKTGASK